MTKSTAEQKSALLVDQDSDCVEAVRQSLFAANLDLVQARTVAEAIELAVDDLPRLVVSELALPDGSGFALCRQFRENRSLSSVPIMLISRWSRESDRILAFECGADDFLGKPFFQRELSLRIKAILRRSETLLDDPEARGLDQQTALTLDAERQEVRIDGSILHLTPNEYALLATLIRHRGRVLSRLDLISEAWTSGENPTERTVDAHVKSLRRKLTTSRHVIETVRGFGYRFSELKGVSRNASG